MTCTLLERLKANSSGDLTFQRNIVARYNPATHSESPRFWDRSDSMQNFRRRQFAFQKIIYIVIWVVNSTHFKRNCDTSKAFLTAEEWAVREGILSCLESLSLVVVPSASVRIP